MRWIAKLGGAALALGLAVPFQAAATPFSWTVDAGSTIAVTTDLSCFGQTFCSTILGGSEQVVFNNNTTLFGDSGGVVANSDISTGSLSFGTNGVFPVPDALDPNVIVLTPAWTILSTAINPPSIGLVGNSISSLGIFYDFASAGGAAVPNFGGTWAEGVVNGPQSLGGQLVGGFVFDLYNEVAGCNPTSSPPFTPVAGCTVGANPQLGVAADPGNPDNFGGTLEWISPTMFEIRNLAGVFQLVTQVSASGLATLNVTITGVTTLNLTGTLAAPEPNTLALVGTGLGLFGLAAWRRRKA